MAKRFTDTNKWKKPYIRGLQAPYKLLWFYILDDCDHAGIWEVDFEVAAIRIGESVNEADALKIFGNHVIQIAKHKWWIPDFISFQYGELNDKNRLHQSVIQILTKFQIESLAPYKGLTRGQGKEQEQEQGTGQGHAGETEDVFKHFGSYESSKNYFIINSQIVGSQKYRVNGSDGMREFFLHNQSQVNYPEFIDKFMRAKNGAHFNDFMHVFNTFNKYVTDQYK